MTTDDDSSAEKTERGAHDSRSAPAQRVQALELVARDVAHGVNNVLAVVRGNLEHLSHRLAGGAIDMALLSECLDEMLRATERADELVRQLQRATDPVGASSHADGASDA